MFLRGNFEKTPSCGHLERCVIPSKQLKCLVSRQVLFSVVFFFKLNEKNSKTGMR